MDRKTISMISYFTIIGWIISFVVYCNGGRSSFAQYHLKQSFGIGVFETLLGIGFVSIYPTIPIVSRFFCLLGAGTIIILIFGIINAVNQKRKPLPLIGFLFLDRFYFIEY
jgi:uncharacterized membrane protein